MRPRFLLVRNDLWDFGIYKRGGEKLQLCGNTISQV